ncbi:MAG: hypothetical protein RIR10_221 [Planctomycetota bacterium]
MFEALLIETLLIETLLIETLMIEALLIEALLIEALLMEALFLECRGSIRSSGHALEFNDRAWVRDFDTEEFGVSRKASCIVAISEDDKRRNSSEKVEHRLAADVTQVHDAFGTTRDEEIDGASRAVRASVGI